MSSLDAWERTFNTQQNSTLFVQKWYIEKKISLWSMEESKHVNLGLKREIKKKYYQKCRKNDHLDIIYCIKIHILYNTNKE